MQEGSWLCGRAKVPMPCFTGPICQWLHQEGDYGFDGSTQAMDGHGDMQEGSWLCGHGFDGSTLAMDGREG